MASSGSVWAHGPEHMPDRMTDGMSNRMPDRMSEYEIWQIEFECQNIYQIECQLVGISRIK